jgi:hypothetical protein
MIMIYVVSVAAYYRCWSNPACPLPLVGCGCGYQNVAKGKRRPDRRSKVNRTTFDKSNEMMRNLKPISK